MWGAPEYSPDGRRVVTSSFDRTARVWDATVGDPACHHRWRGSDRERDAQPGRPPTRDDRNGRRSADLEHEHGCADRDPPENGARVVSAVLGADGSDVITADANGDVRVWDAATGKLRVSRKVTGELVTAVPSRDGTQIAAVSVSTAEPPRSRVVVWDGHPVRADGELGCRRDRAGSGLQLGRRAPRRLDTGRSRRRPRRYRRATQSPPSRPLPRSRRHDSVPTARFSLLPATMALRGSGTSRADASGSGSATIRRLSPRRSAPTAPGCSPPVRTTRRRFGTRPRDASSSRSEATGPSSPTGASVSSGRWVVTASLDGTARVWDALTGQEIALFRHPAEVTAASLDLDERLVLTLAADGRARLFRCETCVPLDGLVRLARSRLDLRPRIGAVENVAIVAIQSPTTRIGADSELRGREWSTPRGELRHFGDPRSRDSRYCSMAVTVAVGSFLLAGSEPLEAADPGKSDVKIVLGGYGGVTVDGAGVDCTCTPWTSRTAHTTGRRPVLVIPLVPSPSRPTTAPSTAVCDAIPDSSTAVALRRLEPAGMRALTRRAR